MSLILEHIVGSDEQGLTVEILLKRHFGISSGLLCELKYSDRIFINNKVCRSVDTVETGDRVTADVAEYCEDFGNITPFKYELDILYEDDFLIIVNKPGYMESHPCHSNYETTLANAIMYHWSQNGEYHKYHIANRLDKGTSGICVIAKNRFSHSRLSEQMQNGKFQKYYVALVHGKLSAPDGVIELPIGRVSKSVIKREVRADGKFAKTIYNTITCNDKYSLVEIKLETGRTHQIRVHFSHMGNPLVGDWLYGNGDNEKEIISRQALHAGRVEFFHPLTNEKLSFTAKIPDEIKNLINPA
ncbi:MAG: RluA family pseudouridine synthase [Clostridia bacterium]|nr:RluA family pseudouridine synthase [Clostridia bacterium]